MAYLHFNRTSRWSHSLHSEPPAVPEHQIGLRRPTPSASTNTARPAPPSKEHHRIASKNPTSLRRANAKIQPFRRIGPNQTGLRGPAARSRRIVSVSRRRKWHGSVKKTPPPHATAGQWHGVVEQEEALSPSCQGEGSSRRQWRRRGEGRWWGGGGVGNEPSEGEGIMDKQEERESRERQGCEGKAQMFLDTLFFFGSTWLPFSACTAAWAPG
jgi:hypothetical protein